MFSRRGGVGGVGGGVSDGLAETPPPAPPHARSCFRPRRIFGHNGAGPAGGGVRPFPGAEAWADCARRIRVALQLRRVAAPPPPGSPPCGPGAGGPAALGGPACPAGEAPATAVRGAGGADPASAGSGLSGGGLVT